MDVGLSIHLHHEWSMIGVQCQLMICRGHIRAFKDALQMFLWLMVLCEIDIFSQILHFCLHFGCSFRGSKMGSDTFT